MRHRTKKKAAALGIPDAPKKELEEKAKRAPRGVIVGDQPLWDGAARIGGGLTPQTISAIIREVDAGYPRRLADLANECRQRDCHLQAVLSVMEESLSSLEYQVVPADKPAPKGKRKTRSKDAKAAAWVKEKLDLCPAFRRLVADLTGAFFHGFAVVEIVWGKVEQGRIVPVDFRIIPQRRFEFRREDGKLVLHDIGQKEIDLAGTYANKFVTFQPRVNGDVPSREGLSRALVWMSVMRNWGIADWLKTGETSWKPWLIGKYGKSSTSPTSPEDRSSLETILRRLTTDLRAVIPETDEINITWPQGATQRGSAHAELVNQLGNEISKAVLGQTETTQASSSSGYAQAKVHDSVRKDLLESRARQVATVITRDVIAPMIRLNFGDSVDVPRFEFVTQDPPDLEKFAKAVAAMRTAGAKIPAAWFYEEAGIPQPEEGEEMLGDGEEDENGGDESGSDDDGGSGGKPDGGSSEKPDAEPEDEADDDEPDPQGDA